MVDLTMGVTVFFSLDFFYIFSHAYNITMITICFCWMVSPSGARTGVLSVGVGFSSFPWQLPGSGPFFVYHRPIRDPAANLWLLDPLLANLFGVRFTSMSTSVCTP